MKIKFIGWVLAHRSDLVGQSPTLQSMVGGIATPSRSRARSGRSAGKDFAVIGIVLALLLLCLPLLRRAIEGRRPPHHVLRQMAQLNSIDTAIELFNSEFDYYPPAEAFDPVGEPYCGAMKLCEAAMGQDLMGIHPNSIFGRDGTDGKGTMLYLDANDLSVTVYKYNEIMRKGPYLPPEIANAYHLNDLYEDVGPFDGNDYLICDESRRIRHISTGKRIGMPVL